MALTSETPRDILEKAIDDVAEQVMQEIADDFAAMPDTAEVARLHMAKPWVPNFWASLVSPLKPTSRAFLKLSVLRQDGRVWYLPSFLWWRNHTRHAHLGGPGCSVEAHETMLTEGPEAMVLYADLLKDQSLRVLGRRDFEMEAAWWGGNFPANRTEGS